MPQDMIPAKSQWPFSILTTMGPPESPLVIYVEDEAVGGQRISNATKSLLNILHAKQREAFDLRYN